MNSKLTYGIDLYFMKTVFNILVANIKGIDNLGDQAVDGRIILK
jgi:hypothetical protein